VNPIEAGFVPLQAADQPGLFSSPFVPITLMILIFYFLVIRPQQKRQRELDQALKGIEKNDNVVTAGGLHGKVVGIADDILTIEIAALKTGERVRAKISRAKVDSVTKGKKEDES
jgi:preprotein translocase subunit YajC